MDASQIVPALCGISVLALVWFIVYHTQRSRTIQRNVTRLRQFYDPLLCFSPWKGGKYRLVDLMGETTKWRKFIIVITGEHIAFYPPAERDAQAEILFKNDQLQWFGRPEKYIYGINEIWLHYERGGRWYVLQVTLHQTDMQKLVRAIKTITTDDIVTAYRRRRPYIHHDPLTASPATENIHGAWALDTPVQLYIMPLHLVIFSEGVVAHQFAMNSIRQVEALRRLDADDPAGLVRFTIGETTLAYALNDYQTFAQALADAAKRSLEIPVGPKRKGKAYDDEWDNEWDDEE